MNDVTRSTALNYAILFHEGKDGLAAVLNTAKQFAAFIADGSSAAVPAGTKTEKPTKEKPAKVDTEMPAKEAAAKQAEPTGPTLEEVKDKVNELLQANLRKGALDLFDKYEAKNASGLKATDYAAFIEAADALLMAG